MIKEFEIKGLEKLVNSSAIKAIYPMVDHINIRYNGELYNPRGWGGLEIDIFINDPTITKENMYEKEFDPHYLVEYHMNNYYQYFNINKPVTSYIVWNPDGDIIVSWNK